MISISKVLKLYTERSKKNLLQYLTWKDSFEDSSGFENLTTFVENCEFCFCFFFPDGLCYIIVLDFFFTKVTDKNKEEIENIFAFLQAHEIASLAMFLKVLAYHPPPPRVRTLGLIISAR